MLEWALLIGGGWTVGFVIFVLAYRKLRERGWKFEPR